MNRVRVAIGVAVVLLPGLVLAPAWRLGGLGAGEDDILYYYPMRWLLHAFVAQGELPLWQPWTGLGRPYLADPQTALFYPPTWIFAVLPTEFAYPASLWAHYSLAILGAYRLLRAGGLRRDAAMLGGIAFAFCGFMLAHRAHLAMHHAAAWTPWVFWRLARYANAGTWRDGRRLALAALPAAMQCLAGHVQIAALTAMGSLVFLAAGRSPAAIARWLLAWMLAGGLFAVQLVPTLLYTMECTRGERTFVDFVENSWNPAAALTLVMPMLLGQRTPNFFDQPWWGPSHQVEQFAYVGLLPLVLAALVLRCGWRADPQLRAWVLLGLFALLLALGQFGPICPLLYWMPGASLFRVPARALLLVHLAAAVLAARALHDLGPELSPAAARLRLAAQRWSHRPLRTAAILVAVPLGLVLLSSPLLPASLRAEALFALRPWSSAVWVPLIVAVGALVVLQVVSRPWFDDWRRWTVAAATIADLAIIGWTIDVPAGVRSADALRAPVDAAWLDDVRQSGQRLWVVTRRERGLPGEYTDPVEKLVANTNVLQRIPSLTDYGPLQPRPFDRAFGFKPWGEAEQAATLLDRSKWMRLANVGWVLLCDPGLPAPTGADLVRTTPRGWRLYRCPDAAGLAAFESAEHPGAVRFEWVSSRAVRVEVDPWPRGVAELERRPGQRGDEPSSRVIVSLLSLPGWRARVNGEPAPIETVGPLIAVRVPSSEPAVIEADYWPPGLATGSAVSAAVGFGVIAIGLAGWLRRRTDERPPPSRSASEA